MKNINTNGAPLPRKESGVFWVEQPAALDVIKFRVYSPQPWGVWTHYEGKTGPCYEKHCYCHPDHNPETLRWKGYLFGWNYKRNKNTFIQLTPIAVEQLGEQLTGEQLMRGLTIVVRRTKSANGRLYVEVAQYMDVDPAGLPKDVDPRASLYSLWKLKDPGHRWATNPLRDLAGPKLLAN